MLEEQTETTTHADAAQESPGSPAPDAGKNAPPPVKKTTTRTRRTTAKKAAAKPTEADSGGAPEAATEAQAADAGAEAPAKKAAAKRTTKKTTAKRATKKTTASEARPEAGESEAGESEAGEPQAGTAVAQPLFQAPDTSTAKKTAARRATKKSAAAAAEGAVETSGEAAGSAEPAPEKAPARKTTAKKTTKKAPAKKSAAKKAAATSTAADEAGTAGEPAGSSDTPSTRTPSTGTPSADTPSADTPSGGGTEQDHAVTQPGATAGSSAGSTTAETGTAPGDADDEGRATEKSDETDGSADGEDGEGAPRRRRRRGGRRRRKGGGNGSGNGEAETGQSSQGKQSGAEDATSGGDSNGENDSSGGSNADQGEGDSGSSRRRRRRRRSGEGGDDSGDDPENTVTRVRKARSAEDEITSFSGSTRLEAKKQRRREGREAGRRRAPIISEAEFLARREAVDRAMVIRQRGDLTQIAVLEDKVLVEHYVARESQTSLIGNVYLGRVQNVLPSMEAAFIDIGKGRNAVLYAGEVNWELLGAKDGGQRKIEQVLKPGQAVLVQVTKDPIGHKGARLTSQISLPGRFLVYVPGGTTSGISRKLPEGERNRLKNLLKEIVPDTAGVIVRTAAEGASEDELTRDVQRLTARWEDIESKVAEGKAPELLYGEPDLTLKVVRDLFTEDFGKLVVSGDDAWDMVENYVEHVAPDLAGRLEKHDDSDGDAFSDHRIDEQIAKALERKVWLPSGGSLVIDRTEAMTVVDVNTGKFTGSGGNLEETVTKNNLEAAEEIVRQLRLRDIGGIIVVDFIDMVLESNRDLVLRRLVECLGRDRTRHQVAEVTSLGLVQMTRKRIGTGLLEAFSESCEACQGRGLVVHSEPVEPKRRQNDEDSRKSGRRSRGRGKGDGSGQDQGSSRREAGSSGSSDGKGATTAEASSGEAPRRPTPAEFAAMAGAEKHEHETPVAPAGAEQPAGESVSGPQVSQPQDGQAPDGQAPDGQAPDGQAPDGQAPSDGGSNGDDTALSAPSVPAAPRIVTSTRRIGARRAAGPPASTPSAVAVQDEQPDASQTVQPEEPAVQPEEPAVEPEEAAVQPEEQPDVTSSDESPATTPDLEDPTEEDDLEDPAQAGDLDDPADAGASAAHVPVKKKGARKR